jgi:hypothetical protein
MKDSEVCDGMVRMPLTGPELMILVGDRCNVIGMDCVVEEDLIT